MELESTRKSFQNKRHDSLKMEDKALVISRYRKSILESLFLNNVFRTILTPFLRSSHTHTHSRSLSREPKKTTLGKGRYTNMCACIVPTHTLALHTELVLPEETTSPVLLFVYGNYYERTCFSETHELWALLAEDATAETTVVSSPAHSKPSPTSLTLLLILVFPPRNYSLLYT